jgi:hypothetical protein
MPRASFSTALRSTDLAGHWSDDDYDVTCNGATVGRIYHANPHSQTGYCWFWGVEFSWHRDPGPSRQGGPDGYALRSPATSGRPAELCGILGDETIRRRGFPALR